MDLPAFLNHKAEKLKIVTSAMRMAIAELESMAKADTAYIAIIGFGASAGLVTDAHGNPFIKSVTQIINEYGEGAIGLFQYLYQYFKEDTGGVGRGGTDITEALKLARNIYDHTLAGDLSPLGVNVTARLISHSSIITQQGQPISVPNIRIMIYSDGAHNGSSLTNAFGDLSPSPLMTAFIGNEQASNDQRIGADQMRLLATDCPEHGQKGYFLINAPEEYTTLRHLFRMASGASGFCPHCLRLEFEAFE